MAGTDAEPGSDIPMASPTEAMVFAVTCRHTIRHPTGRSFDLDQVVDRDATFRFRTNTFEHVNDRDVFAPVAAGQAGASVQENRRQIETGCSHEHSRPATCRQPAIATRASNLSACITNSTESAITSPRDQRRPHSLVSHRDRVGHRDGGERQPHTPGSGYTVFGVFGLARRRSGCRVSPRCPRKTTPTWGFEKSSSDSPTALNMARAAAFAGPSVTS